MNALEEYCRINNISTSSSETSSLLAQDGFSKLLNVKGLLIKQSFQPFESLTGFQQENSYSILATDENGIDFRISTKKHKKTLKNCIIFLIFQWF